MPNGIIAQNNTFENLFGLDSHESIASYNTEENVELLPHEKTDTSLEFEDLDVKEKDLTPIEEKDDWKNLAKILPEIKHSLAAKGESEKKSDLPFVQTISGKMGDERNGKYVRYGKSFVINGCDHRFVMSNVSEQ